MFSKLIQTVNMFLSQCPVKCSKSIAKFPSKMDAVDKAAWEFLTYKLATVCGIEMAESKLEKVAGPYHTFLTKRFDRENGVVSILYRL